MSNDDDEKGLIKFIKLLAPKIPHNLILAFCPAFEMPRKGKEILEMLHKKYELYFFVLKTNYKGTDSRSDDQINVLKDFGKVEVYKKRAEAEERAIAFKKFIKANS